MLDTAVESHKASRQLTPEVRKGLLGLGGPTTSGRT